MASSSTTTREASSSCSKPCNKLRIPKSILELLDLAIYTFAAISGLRSTDKIRGEQVLHGVCSLFGRLLDVANPETREEFTKLSPKRLGNWATGQEPTTELLTLISSRLKLSKRNNMFSSTTKEPVPPSILFDVEQHLDEEEDRVITDRYPRCWRCARRCRFCRLRKEDNMLGSMRSELFSPLLEVIDDMAEDIPVVDIDEVLELPEGLEDLDKKDAPKLKEKCLSNEDMVDTDEDNED